MIALLIALLYLIVYVIVGIIIVEIICWLIGLFVPVPPKIKQLLYALVGIFALLYLISALPLLHFPR